MTSARWIALSLVAVPMASGCERDATNEGPVEEVGDEPAGETAKLVEGKDSVAEQIATARCDQEERCDDIGTDQEYASREACVAQVRADWREDLNVFECPGGINSDELNECLEEIRNNDCGNPFDTLGRIVACRPGDICEAVP